MRLMLTVILLLLASVLSATGEERTKATVLVRGVHCEACVAAIRQKLAEVKGTRVDPEAIRVGDRPRFFSAPFVVEVGDTLENGIGALAKATASARTPHRDDLPPRLNLVLFTERRIDEESVMALRAALREINGVLVQENGGLGGFPPRGFYWVRLEPAGGADLQDILQAARQAVEVSLLDD